MKPGRNDPCSCGSGKKYRHCCQGIIESRSGDSIFLGPTPAELNHLGKLFDSGRYAELESRSLILVKQYPNHAHVWKGLSLSLYMQGKDALYAFQRVAELMSEDAEAQFNLGVALKSVGRLDEAAASYRRAVTLKPDYAEAHSNLGNILKALGRHNDALTCFLRALKINPDSADTHNNLGTAYKDLGQLEEAVSSYRKAVALKPEFAMAYYNLGNAHMELGQFDGALASYRRAIEIKPDFVNALSNLGTVLREHGQLDDAAECYRRALEIEPKYIEALLGSAQLHMENGGMVEAEEMIRKALEINPNDIDARIQLIRVKKVKNGDENFSAVMEVEEELQRGVMSDKKAIHLHFVLGKGFDDIGDFDNAFPHFIEGCRLKRTTINYDAKKTTQYFGDIIRVFDHATIERLYGGGDQSRLPIFVLGMPRSGTTLTEQIIASHPDVHGAGELPDLMKISQRDVAGKGATFPDNILGLDQAGLATWSADYVAGLRLRAPNARCITDKMPANFINIGLIYVMLPNAKIIHVNRNPVDTCLSCFTQLFARKQEFSYNLAELGRYYVDYARMMEHWRTVLPAGAFLDVQYEDIVADQQNQARRIIDYCGLEWNDACIDFYKNKRLISTASLTQVRQPIYKTSVERWRNYEKFLAPLLDALAEFGPK